MQLPQAEICGAQELLELFERERARVECVGVLEVLRQLLRDGVLQRVALELREAARKYFDEQLKDKRKERCVGDDARGELVRLLKNNINLAPRQSEALILQA